MVYEMGASLGRWGRPLRINDLPFRGLGLKASNIKDIGPGAPLTGLQKFALVILELFRFVFLEQLADLTISIQEIPKNPRPGWASLYTVRQFALNHPMFTEDALFNNISLPDARIIGVFIKGSMGGRSPAFFATSAPEAVRPLRISEGSR